MGALWSDVLETRRLKGRCTAENLVAASWGVAKRFELSPVPREEFPKVTTVTSDEAANMVAAGKLSDREVNHSYRPPYGIQECSAVIRNNYGQQSLFTQAVCKCH